ncbi:hydroxyisourate hydrolase [Alkalicoccus urumqiensis]|uniref:5-hydroxyisourate hydrolase n=1 Tax=Alkalicoccus urumqiensis TaxID=1548213 RepID=A0A2P6MLM5_ALKUR|nr:hydroxyisourate hydrolase [Alkalicoccus urumqiensis]PRO67173.1 hydroxyisourate hydrolase [Alkalicoccus urumqiensis]
MSGKLTTHVLDTSIGRPAEGLLVELWRYEPSYGEFQKMCEGELNEDGRFDKPLLEGETFKKGRYELLFHVHTYFEKQGLDQSEPPFYNVVPVSFGIAHQNEHYHVPLLIAPGGYSTYRGS